MENLDEKSQTLAAVCLCLLVLQHSQVTCRSCPPMPTGISMNHGPSSIGLHAEPSYQVDKVEGTMRMAIVNSLDESKSIIGREIPCEPSRTVCLDRR